MRQINEINNKNLFLYQIFYFKITFVNSQLENTNSKGDLVLNTSYLIIENDRIFHLFIVLGNLKISCNFYGKGMWFWKMLCILDSKEEVYLSKFDLLNWFTVRENIIYVHKIRNNSWAIIKTVVFLLFSPFSYRSTAEIHLSI